MLWDVFCRVIDNFGDVGVCWRLCADLAARGEQVRLWLDDAAALGWMAPNGAAGVSVHRWADADTVAAPGDVVVEAFGCNPPDAFVRGMAAAALPPRWINLEYLSAEAYVERSHLLTSPQSTGTGAGLTKWFFYPGFTPATGGLIREPGLQPQQKAFDRNAWLDEQGLRPRDGERLVSLFCYPQAPLPALLAALLTTVAGTECLLLLTADAPQPAALPRGIRLHRLPFLTQPDYDRLLWSCDLNFVRGEDSFVRAQWAGRPFVWQIYPQLNHAHAAKLEAYLARLAPVNGVRELWRGWNGLGDMPTALPPLEDWAQRCSAWRDDLQRQPDLVTQLLQFAARPG